SEVMVDAEDLRLVEMTTDGSINRECARQIVTDGFLYHDAGEVGRAAFRDQARRIQPFDACGHCLGRHREIVDPVRRQSVCSLDLLEAGLQAGEALRLIETCEI